MDNPTPTQDIPVKKMSSWKKIGLIVLALIILGVIANLANDESTNDTATNDTVQQDVPAPASTPNATNDVKVGQEGYLRLPGNDDQTQVICLGETKEDFNEINKSLVAKDFMGIINNSGAFCVHNGSKVLVIDKDFPARKVRVLKGTKPVDQDKVGLAGYVNYEWVLAQ